MAQHQVRERGEIKVFGKELNRGDQVEDLEQPARFAHRQAQREFRLGFGKVLGAQEVVGERLGAEVQDEDSPGAPARTALEGEAHPAIAPRRVPLARADSA